MSLNPRAAGRVKVLGITAAEADLRQFPVREDFTQGVADE
jgi:hypothetical protein